MAGNASPVTLALASPVHFMAATNPVTLLIHGTNDTVIPVNQSLKLKTMLEAAHVQVNIRLLKNENHFYSAEATRQLLDETNRFLDANLK